MAADYTAFVKHHYLAMMIMCQLYSCGFLIMLSVCSVLIEIWPMPFLTRLSLSTLNTVKPVQYSLLGL